MERVLLNDETLENVVGGSIRISADKTTCGHNCDNQYKIVNFTAMRKFYSDNCKTMREADMLAEMATLGYITKL